MNTDKKRCFDCKEYKNRSEFHKSKREKDGLKGDCKECRKRKAAAFYERNKEEINQRNRDYYYSDLNKQRERAKKYAEQHKEEILAKGRQRRKENPEKEKERYLKYYQSHLEHERARSKAKRAADPEYYKLKSAEWYRNKKVNDPEHLTQSRRASCQKRRARLKNAIVPGSIIPTVELLRDRDGDLCAFCSVELDFGTYSIEDSPDNHVWLEHLQPISRGGKHTMENTVLFCKVCNRSKGNKTLEEFS